MRKDHRKLKQQELNFMFATDICPVGFSRLTETTLLKRNAEILHIALACRYTCCRVCAYYSHYELVKCRNFASTMSKVYLRRKHRNTLVDAGSSLAAIMMKSSMVRLSIREIQLMYFSLKHTFFPLLMLNENPRFIRSSLTE